MKKAIVFLADGCEMIEALTPVDLLRRAGIEVVTVSINGTDTIKSSHNVEIKAEHQFDKKLADDADIVILPGGMPGTKYLQQHSGVEQIVKEFNQNGKYIAAICAAPTIFGGLGLLKGKHATCYPSMEGQLTGAEVCYDEVVVDGNIITSRGMGTAIAFSLAIIECLLGKEKAEEIGHQVVYQDGE